MSPLPLNPTAPAFRPPASTSGIPETAADIDFGLLCLDAGLSPGLDIDPADPPSPVYVANEVAVALLGQSLLNALYEPFTPSSLTHGSDDNDEDDDLVDLLSITSTPPSIASSRMSAWSPATSSPGTTAPCSAVKVAGYTVMPALSHAERDEWRTTLSPLSSSGDIWASDGRRGRPDAICNTHNGAQNVFANPEVTDESGSDHESSGSEQQPSQWGRRYRACEDPRKSILVSNTGVSPSVEAQQLIISPSVQRTPSLPLSPTRTPGLAPLWPLLSALHRNLSRSRPDLYGAALTPTYLNQGSLMPSDLSTQALGPTMTSWPSSIFSYPSVGLI